MRRNLALIIFLGWVEVTQAQDYAFRVLATKGKVEIRSPQGWEPVKTGSRLTQDDELKLLTNAYLALAHVGGRPMEVKEAGTYKVADLAARVKTGSSLINKYTDFILSKEEEGITMVATGAVHRGAGDELDVYYPDMKYTQVYSDQLSINWTRHAEGSYRVVFRSTFEDVFTTTTSDTVLHVDLSDGRLKNQSALFVTVSSENTPEVKSKDFLVRRMEGAERTGIETLLKEMQDPLSEESAVQKYILAGFFEEHRLYFDANTAYLQAILLAPDVTAYRQAYEYFLLRNGMKDPPKK